MWKTVKGRSAIIAPSLPTLLTKVIPTRKKTFIERRDIEHNVNSSNGYFFSLA